MPSTRCSLCYYLYLFRSCSKLVANATVDPIFLPYSLRPIRLPQRQPLLQRLLLLLRCCCFKLGGAGEEEQAAQVHLDSYKKKQINSPRSLAERLSISFSLSLYIPMYMYIYIHIYIYIYIYIYILCFLVFILYMYTLHEVSGNSVS